MSVYNAQKQGIIDAYIAANSNQYYTAPAPDDYYICGEFLKSESNKAALPSDFVNDGDSQNLLKLIVVNETYATAEEYNKGNLYKAYWLCKDRN